jgi:hypothetical protein
MGVLDQFRSLQKGLRLQPSDMDIRKLFPMFAPASFFQSGGWPGPYLLPGHGPTLRLTYKTEGKTISEALPTPAAVRKAEREIGEFRRYQQISRDFIDVNEKICRLRPVEESLTPQEKKRPKRFIRRSPAK